MKHSEGEWRVVLESDMTHHRVLGVEIITYWIMAKDSTLALLTKGKGIDEMSANAYLISAAPEMYELLNEWVLRAQISDTPDDLATRTIKALSKAEGK